LEKPINLFIKLGLGILFSMMVRALQIFSAYKWYFLVAVLHFCILIFITRNGVLLTYDSIDFYAIAHNFRESFQLTHQNGEILKARPPFYPILISIMAYSKTIQENNILIFWPILVSIVNLSVFYQFIKTFIQNEILKKWSFAMFALGSPIMLCTVYFWSENIFIALVMLLIISLKGIENESNNSFIPFVICLILIPLTRYIGIVLILPVVVYFVFFCRKNPIKLVLVISASFFPLVFWQLRNIYLTGNGPQREFVNKAWWQSSYSAIEVMSAWYIPPQLPFVLKLVFCLVLAVIFVVVFIQSITKKAYFNAFLVLFFLFYIAFVVIIHSFIHFAEEVDNRFLAPVYPVFLVLMSMFFEKYLTKNQSKLLILRNICLVITLLYVLVRIFYNANQWKL